MSTSRVGRKPVTIPSGVVVTINGQDLAIKGPKGEKHLTLNPFVEVVLDDGSIKVQNNPKGGYSRNGSGQKLCKSIIGTTRAEIANVIHGVTHIFERKLTIIGVGYKAQSKGKVLGLAIGCSHPVDYDVPEGITIETPTATEIIVKGIDKALVGLVADKIRAYLPPEPYKGKGIRYADENVVRKETKKK